MAGAWSSEGNFWNSCLWSVLTLDRDWYECLAAAMDVEEWYQEAEENDGNARAKAAPPREFISATTTSK